MVQLSSLNPQQRQAVQTVRGPVLILAGAGTGKTRVITSRIAYLIEQGIHPDQILAVTFTNKAAREMLARVRQLLPGKRGASAGGEERVARPTVCTFHSLCVRILRQHIERLGYKRNFVIYDETEQLGAVKKILSHITGCKADPKEVLSWLSRHKNAGQPRTGEAVSETAALAEQLRPRYESALHACNAVDFDDLILLVLRLFREHPEVLRQCREKFRFVMVDEYQDTNAAQFELMHALTREHRNLCVVGDDDQSIYGWRGAEIANLLDLEKHFPEVKIIKLEQNYRSTNVILKAANAVICNNARRRAKALWSQKGEGLKIVLHAFANDEEEARTIVEEIEYRRQAQRIPWTDQAILFRTNQQSRPLETALRRASVRYQLIGGQSFFDRREIRDFTAYLKVLIHPDDDISLLRIANVPARGLSEATMERLLAASHEWKSSVFSTMKNPAVFAALPAKARQSVEAFVDFLQATRKPLLQAEPLNLKGWAERFLAEIGYFNELKRSEKNAEAAENRVRNVRELVATLDRTESNAPLALDRLHAFLDEIALDADRREEKESAVEGVTLITMHSCKGLEFPHVYIVGVEDGLLPHGRSKMEGTLDEERRLFYVAITRAMQTLTISHCQGRTKYGRVEPCQPSPFLRELPDELVELAEERGKRPVTVETGKAMFANLRAIISP